MIQFNLLPDVKVEFMKMQRTKRLAMMISAAVIALCVVVMILFFSMVDVVQKKSLSDLNNDIKRYSSQISNTQNIDRILTIQSQLNALPALDAQKPLVTLLPGYLAQITPNNITISNLAIDFTKNSVDITGGSDTLATVDQYVDTLKFTKYQDATTNATTLAFSQVVLSNFGTNPGGGSTYEINASFDPIIFSSAHKVTLIVPSQITTRSVTDKPQTLFVQPPGSNNKGQ